MRRCASESAWTASRLGRRALLQGRLPDPRRRPRSDRRAPHPPAEHGRGRGRHGRGRGLRGRCLHDGGGDRRPVGDDVRHGPPVRDRRRGRALEGLRRRVRGERDGRDGRRHADRGVLRARGGPLQGPRRARQGRAEGGRPDRRGEPGQAPRAAALAGAARERARPAARQPGRPRADRPGRRPPAAPAARAGEARDGARPRDGDRRRGGAGVLRRLGRAQGVDARRRAGGRRQQGRHAGAAGAPPAGRAAPEPPVQDGRPAARRAGDRRAALGGPGARADQEDAADARLRGRSADRRRRAVATSSPTAARWS